MLDLPNNIKSSNLYLDLAIEFQEHGHEVYAIAPAKSDQKTNLYQEKGINVLRVKTLKQIGVESVFKKGIAQLLLPYQYKLACHPTNLHRILTYSYRPKLYYRLFECNNPL